MTGPSTSAEGEGNNAPDFQRTAQEARELFGGVPPGSTGGTEPAAPAGRTRGPLLRRLPPPPAEAQPGQPRGEALLNGIGRVLERTRVFGRSAISFLTAESTRTRIGELAVGAAASTAVKTILSEWLVNIGAGAATGFVGRVAIGGAAGAIVGAGKEYIKQVRNPNPQAEPSGEEAAELASRRKRFLERFKPTDWRTIGGAAVRGAVFGAVGATVATAALEFAEANGITLERLGSIFTATTIPSGAGEIPGYIPAEGYPDLGGIPQAATGVTEGAGTEPTGPATEGAIQQQAAEAAKQAKEQALGALTSNHEFLERTAAAVGEQIDQSNLAVDEAIRAASMDPTQLSSEAYEKIRMSVQHKMEGLANEAFGHAAGSADNLDPSHLTEIAKQGHDEFVTSLSGTDTHQQLLKSASAALTEHLTVQQEIAENLSQVLSSTPDLATEVITTQRDTVGQMLIDHGYNITWGATDAEVLGAHIAANYNQLSNMWGAMAQVDNLPAGVHFPVSLTDLPNLIEQAQSGDAGALQKLKDALHWIPAGKKFTILNAEQLTKILAALSKT